MTPILLSQLQNLRVDLLFTIAQTEKAISVHREMEYHEIEIRVLEDLQRQHRSNLADINIRIAQKVSLN